MKGSKNFQSVSGPSSEYQVTRWRPRKYGKEKGGLSRLQMKQVKEMMDKEDEAMSKYHDVVTPTGAIPNDLSARHAISGGLVQGDEDFNRIGNKIKIESILMRCFLSRI